MEKMKLYVSGSQIQVVARPAAITAGTVGLEAEFVFDSHWDNLGKTVIFRAGDKTIIAALEQDTHIVPWEVLEKPEVWLFVGIYGANAEGTVVIPTLWTKVAAIYTGVDPEGDPALEPANPIWQQTLARVADMEPQVQEHINNTDNPHGVTCDQIGAVTQKEFRDVVSNLDGSSDPEGLIPHLLNRDNPHGVTAAQAGAAPAGYGLGEQSSAATASWNGINRNSFQRSNTGSPDGGWWHGIVCKEYGSIATELAFKPNGGVWLAAMRGRTSDGEWKEWEYLNPPMVPSVEYRTIERYSGKVVYAKLIDFEALPNADFKAKYEIPQNVAIVDMYGMISYTAASGSTITYPISSGSKISDFYADVSSGYVAIKTTEDLSARTAKITVKYTKD